MLRLKMISDSGAVEFSTAQSVLLYINDTQVILVRVAKLINKNNFKILVDDETKIITGVEIIYTA